MLSGVPSFRQDSRALYGVPKPTSAGALITCRVGGGLQCSIPRRVCDLRDDRLLSNLFAMFVMDGRCGE